MATTKPTTAKKPKARNPRRLPESKSSSKARSVPMQKGLLRGIDAANESRNLIEGLGALDDLMKRPGLRRHQPLLRNAQHGMLSRLAELTGADTGLVAAPELSGAQWISRFPGSSSIDTLADSFRPGAEAFIGAMRSAGAAVTISATLRPLERAYLMHWSWVIARLGGDPKDVPPMGGVDILWDHGDAQASTQAAEDMVAGYGIVAEPALTSRHTQGLAIDMTISWSGDLAIADQSGTMKTITSVPRSGMNDDLIATGATYGVIKASFSDDPPHWSNDGH